MATYVYKYSRYGKGELLSKYYAGYIYDLRGKRFESDADIICKTHENYLCKYTRTSYEYTDITVKGNVAYKNKTLYLTARNNIIYSRNNVELAEYEGNAQEALFAYTALEYATAKTPTTSTTSSSTSASSSNGNSSGGGSGCGMIVGFVGFFGLIVMLSLLIEYYEYYTLFVHVGIPLVVLIITLITRDSFDYSFSEYFMNFIIGLGTGLIVLFCIAPIDMLVMPAFRDQGRTLILNRDLAYTACWILVALCTTFIKTGKDD